MEIQHHHHNHQIILRSEEKHQNEGKSEVQQTNQQVQLLNQPPPSSASSSPSHEFSFTISLHPPPPPPPPPSDINNKSKSPPPPSFAAAIDLSPADEIFFHGHLLPLHLLSGGGGGHLPSVVSPRSSTNSLDSFTLPIKELPHKDDEEDDRHICKGSHVLEGKDRGKSKSFSLFGMPRKPRKGCDGDDEGQKRKSTSFELVKRLVKPFLSLRKGNNQESLRQPPPPPPYNSYSGNLRVKNKKDFFRGRRRGEFSAPVSMRNSPTNSGVLAASGTVTPTKSDSTMEELQAAIQAAIAHCKKSIDAAGEDRVH